MSNDTCTSDSATVHMGMKWCIMAETHCPPAVGYTEASSAMVKPLQPTMIKQTMSPYIRVTEPPRAMVKANVPATPAQLLQMFQPMQMMSTGPISRGVSWARPRLASSAVRKTPSCWVTSARYHGQPLSNTGKEIRN